MKTQLVVLAAWTALLSPLFAGGPQIGITVGNRGGWCPPPVRPICAPVVYRSVPTWYACPPVAFYNWGPNVVVSSSGSGFSTVSPLMGFQAGTPVYRVPAPIIPAQPITVHATRFGWPR